MLACLWNDPLQVSERVVFAEFEWKYHNFLNIKPGEWDLKRLLPNYWNDLVWGSLEIYFPEFGAYVSLKWATAGVLDGRFCRIWVKIPQFFECKKGREGSKNVTVSLLKRSCLQLSRNIFSGSWCIRVSETSHHRCLRWLFLLNLSENTTMLWI